MQGYLPRTVREFPTLAAELEPLFVALVAPCRMDLMLDSEVVVAPVVQHLVVAQLTTRRDLVLVVDVDVDG